MARIFGETSVYSEKTRETLRQVMLVAEQDEPPVKIYGKTGMGKTGGVTVDAWFTGFAPVENPEVCVTIIIEGAGAGGDYAVPIAKRIFDAYFGV